MFNHFTSLTSYYFATTYGQSTYSTSTYSGQTTTETITPGAPNTGFFQSVISGQNELWLIPAILFIAVAIAAITLGVKKLIRTRKT